MRHAPKGLWWTFRGRAAAPPLPQRLPHHAAIGASGAFGGCSSVGPSAAPSTSVPEAPRLRCQSPPLDSGPLSRRHSGWTDFADTLADLWETCPGAITVMIRMAGLSETSLAECCRRQRRFVIRLSDRMGEN